MAFRPAWAEVDLSAIRANVGAVRSASRGAAVWAVVKADAYGHGAVPVARATLEAGADGLAVALVEEGLELRDAGLEAPILLLSEPPPDAAGEVVARHLTPTIYTTRGLQALSRAAAGAHSPVGVQVKLDTGMHRVGADFECALAIAHRVSDDLNLTLDAVWTHFAVADDPAQQRVTSEQCVRFDRFCDELIAAGIGAPRRHAANSAGVLLGGISYEAVRPGIALYGYSPNPAVPITAELRPALSLVARVAHVRRLAAGERLSYGLRYQLPEPSLVATVPIGYADGVPRRLGETGGEVLVAGRRRPIAGAVTMDQILVDCGPDSAVEVGDEVVLLGCQGRDAITADEWASRLGTISYEVLCAIGPRVPRVYRP